MTALEIMKKLQALGRDSYKKVMLNHGVPESSLGVSIAELKKIQKQVKVDHQLALDLYDTGIYDAMYLAGLIADDQKMTKKDLQKWAKEANCGAIAEYTVAWVASGSRFGQELGMEWIDSKNETIASAGWSTLSSLVSITDDEDLDISALKKLLDRVGKTIHNQPNRVRYTMNGFVISVGAYVKELTEAAIATAKKVGPVTVDMSGTACKVPSAVDYIEKIRKRGAIGKKRKTAKC